MQAKDRRGGGIQERALVGPASLRILKLLVLLCLCFFTLRGWLKLQSGARSDFDIYREAGRAVVDGVLPAQVPGYIYPPLLAVLMVPLAYLPRALASALWQSANLLVLLWCARACAALCSSDEERERALPWLALLCVLRLVDSDLANGQVNIFTLALLLLGLTTLRRGRSASGGAWIGLAAALKVLPGTLLLWLAWRRCWRALAGGLAAGIAASLALPALALGPSGLARDLEQWVRSILWPALEGGRELLHRGGYLPGQSLVAAGYRLLTVSPATADGGTANLLALGVDRARVVIAVLIGLHLWMALKALSAPRLGKARIDWAAESSVVLCLTLLVAPLVHKAHLVWLLLPCTSLWATWSEREAGASRLWIGTSALLGVLWIGLTTPALLGRSSASRLLACNAVCLGTELLFLACCLAAWSTTAGLAPAGEPGDRGRSPQPPASKPG